MNPETRINANDDPPSGRIEAILWESMPSLVASRTIAIAVQPTKIPRKPARNEMPGLRGIATATANAEIAIDHQGNNVPRAIAQKAVRSVASINLIIALRFRKVNYIVNPVIFFLSSLHYP
jgi:hypothetical protein